MCSRVTHCFVCIKPDTATKIIGWFYTILSFGLVVLFGVPSAAPHSDMPPERGYFYNALTASNVVLTLFSILLLCAVHKGVPVLVWPWLATAWLTGAALVVLCLYGAMTLPCRAEDQAAAIEEGLTISVYFLYAALLIYCASVVHSYHQEMVRNIGSRLSQKPSEQNGRTLLTSNGLPRASLDSQETV